MTDSHFQMQLASSVPTVYIGFSGVLHRGQGLLDPDGNVTLDSGKQLFELALDLSDAIAPYPDVRLVLTTEWTRKLGDARVIAMLPADLRRRVAGTTRLFPPRLGEMRVGTGRTGSILRHVAAHELRNWLAIGDDFAGVPLNLMPRFLAVSNEVNLGTPHVMGELRTWLDANARDSFPTV